MLCRTANRVLDLIETIAVGNGGLRWLRRRILPIITEARRGDFMPTRLALLAR